MTKLLLLCNATYPVDPFALKSPIERICIVEILDVRFHDHVRPLVGYDKKSKRKAHLDAQKVREKEVVDQKSRERSVSVTQINDDVTHMHSSLSAAQFRSFFKPIAPPDPRSPLIITDKDFECESDLVAPAKDFKIFIGGYKSNIPDDEPLNIPNEPTDEPTEDDEGP